VNTDVCVCFGLCFILSFFLNLSMKFVFANKKVMLFGMDISTL
jgi:hypothetical protein